MAQRVATPTADTRRTRLAGSVVDWASRLGPRPDAGMTLRELATLTALGQLPEAALAFVDPTGLRVARDRAVGPWTVGGEARQPWRRERPSVEIRARRALPGGDVSLEAGMDPYRGRYVSGGGRMAWGHRGR